MDKKMCICYLKRPCTSYTAGLEFNSLSGQILHNVALPPSSWWYWGCPILSEGWGRKETLLGPSRRAIYASRSGPEINDGKIDMTFI